MKTDKTLDRHAQMFGLKRKRYLFFFKESDEKLRKRIENCMDLTGRRIALFPCNECLFYAPKEKKCTKIFGKEFCRNYRKGRVNQNEQSI